MVKLKWDRNYDTVTRWLHIPTVVHISAVRDAVQWNHKKGYNAESSLINQLYETACMIEEASHYNVGMWQADSTAAIVPSTPQLTLSEPTLQMGTNQSAMMTKNSAAWHPILKWPAPSGQPPETTQPPVPGSSMKLNFPTKPADWKVDHSTNRSNVTSFECGNPGHRRMEYPHLKLGLGTAAVRAKGQWWDETRTHASTNQWRGGRWAPEHWGPENNHTLSGYREINGVKAHCWTAEVKGCCYLPNWYEPWA